MKYQSYAEKNLFVSIMKSTFYKHICAIVSVDIDFKTNTAKLKTKLLQAQSKRRTLTFVSNALEGKLIPLHDLNRQTAVNIVHLRALETAVESILSSYIYSKEYKSMLRAIRNNFCTPDYQDETLVNLYLEQFPINYFEFEDCTIAGCSCDLLTTPEETSSSIQELQSKQSVAKQVRT